MIKNIEWAKNRIKNTLKFEALNDREVGFKIAMEEALEMINQLDEPEVMSKEWISEHSNGTSRSQYVWVDDLQDLLVPKQELPVIPQFVADYLCRAKADVTLMRVLEIANTRNELPKWKKEYDWIVSNDETFARAWLDGYTVEEEPRSKQMSILVKPSTHERLKLASSLENNSVNGIINDVLEAYLEENKEAIEAYIKVYEKFKRNLDDIN